MSMIPWLGKLQKKLDAELHDAQEDENNAALELIGTLSPDDVTGLKLELSTDTDWNGDACTTCSVSGMHLELVNPIFFNSVRGTPWYLVPGFECKACIIQAMTEDESLSSRDPQDDDDIIMDELCMLERLEKGNYWDQMLINTSGTKQWSKFIREIEADQHEDPAGGVQV